MNGALLINKPAGISSFGVIEEIKRKFKFHGEKSPIMGHGGTLDPFATGLLVVLVGRGVKLARYFLGSDKSYKGVFEFGQSTVPGDPTEPVTDTSLVLPKDIAAIQKVADFFSSQTYLQTPPMHSAKKHNGRPLYELARQGIEIDREPKACSLSHFTISDYQSPLASFELDCTSGTYIRTLAQDLAKTLGTVGMLHSLERTKCGDFLLANSLSLNSVLEQVPDLTLSQAWVPFDGILKSYPSIQVSALEEDSIQKGKQSVLTHLSQRMTSEKEVVVFYREERMVAIARKTVSTPFAPLTLDRVFPH